MALAAPALEHTYHYQFRSALVGEGDRRRLRLATSGGPTANPQFFIGRLLLPVVAADLLLTLGDIARSRFHVPAQMLIRILELADPVVTRADARLRLEAFSACCSVYGRVDFLPEAYEGDSIGRGTTNVDLGPGIRSALAEAVGCSLPALTGRPAARLVPLLRLLDELLAETGRPAAGDARPPLERLVAAGGQAGRLARWILSRG